jgi:hypothetical protein
VFSETSLYHVNVSSFDYWDFLKSDFKSHVKNLGMNWCREEVNPDPVAQSTYQHMTAACDRYTNQIIFTSISVPYSSDLEKTKIMALRERPHNKVVCL